MFRLVQRKQHQAVYFCKHLVYSRIKVTSEYLKYIGAIYNCYSKLCIDGLDSFILFFRNTTGMLDLKIINTDYYCQILIRLEFWQQIFEKSSNIKFHENPSTGSRVFPCEQTADRQTGGRTDR
jgi:hypothetical protein